MDKKWHQNPPTVIALLILFFPLGIYYMWKNNLWSKKTRIIISAILPLGIILSSGDNSGRNNPTPSLITIEDYKSEIPGKYSVCESEDFGMGKTWICMMLELKEDGSYIQYEGKYIGSGGDANLSQYKWVSEYKGTWNIEKDENANTGKPFFALNFGTKKGWVIDKDWTNQIKISGKLAYGGEKYTFRAGDKLED